MGKDEKLLLSVMCGYQDNNIRFSDLQRLLRVCGFVERISGDHHIYENTDIYEIVNIQPIGSKAKGYQVKQIRNIIIKYKLGGKSNV